MAEALFSALGGIGLFLFGMKVMTDALRQLAGAGLRALLARFTTSPLSGVLAGAAATAVVQSSSATIMTVIGFVGAGMLSFPQALGVVFGANIGTTVTGWMVALLGLKLNLGTVSMPILALASVAALLGRPRIARAGNLAAGFAMVFIGLDLMKTAAPLVEPVLAVALMQAGGPGGALLLIVAGAVVTAVVQSSSVGVAMVLVMLSGGSVGLVQAALLVIGMDIGTTAKSLAATAGGSRDMRRTAWGHVGYNLVTGAVAVALVGYVPALGAWIGDDATALVAFHTAFNVAGVILLLPVIGPFARLVEHLVPGGRGPLSEPLDRALLADPSAALDSARAAAGQIGACLFAMIAERLRGGSDLVEAETPHAAIEDLEDFLTELAVPPDAEAVRNRLSALLHLADHLHRLGHRAAQSDRMRPLASEPALRRPALAYAALLSRAAGSPADAQIAFRLRRLGGVIARRTARLRRSVLLREHAGLLRTRDVFEITDALRWLDRSVNHAERIVHYGSVAAQEAPSRADAARDGRG